MKSLLSLCLLINLIAERSRTVAKAISIDLETGSMSPWIDLSPLGVSWNISSYSSTAKDEKSVPKPSVGDKFLVAYGNTASGTAVLSSSVFTASPGDSIQFSFWMPSAYDNNLQLLWVDDDGEHLLFDAKVHNPSPSVSKWRGVFMEFPFRDFKNISLLFNAFVGSNPGDVVALDNILLGFPAANVDLLNTRRSINPRPSCEYFLYDTGSFSSPNFPDDYPNYINCYWHLETNGSGVSINFDPFYTELNHDFVSIYFNSESAGTELYHGMSGNWGSYYFATAQTNNLLVNFYSSASGTAKGFHAFFQEFPQTLTSTVYPTSLHTSKSTSKSTSEPTLELMSPPLPTSNSGAGQSIRILVAFWQITVYFLLHWFN